MAFLAQSRRTKRSRNGIHAALALLGLMALAPRAQAQGIVYDNGTFGVTGAIRMSDLAAADDFTLASPTSVDAIRFWAMDNSFSVFDNFSGSLTWYIYEGSAGSPSPNAIPSTTILSQGTASGSDITITDTGSLLLGNPRGQIVQLDFSIPTQNLAAGTYWLRLKEGMDSSGFDLTPIFWISTGAANTGNGFRTDADEVTPTTWDTGGSTNTSSNGTSTTSDLAFQLLSSSASAPEPGTLVLLALGTVGGVVVKRRK
jgi:PEP-CTERM motif